MTPAGFAEDRADIAGHRADDPPAAEELSPMSEAVQDLIQSEPWENQAGRIRARTAEPDATFTDSQLAQQLRDNGATNVSITGESETDDLLARDGGLPQDLFKVSGLWADYYQNGKRFVTFYGRWNYDDSVIGSGNPYDAAGIVVDNFDDRCWTNVSTGLKTQDNSGDVTNLRSLKFASQLKTVWNVHDDTAGFELKTDMGFAWIEFRRDKLGCAADKRGKFYHEHNQQGGGTWTAGITLGAFNLEYSGDVPDKVLMKSTKLKNYNYSE